MVRTRSIAVVVALALVRSAGADLVSASSATLQLDASTRAVPALLASSNNFASLEQLSGIAAPNAPTSKTTIGLDDDARSPRSETLALVALSGLGAWQLGRSTRKLHLSTTPGWYHSGAPAQIGHTLVYDLEFVAPLPVKFENWRQPFLLEQADCLVSLELPSAPLISPRGPRAPPSCA